MQYNGAAGAGTGMVINPDGLVLTNNHVIEDSTKITATVRATGKTYPATVIGYDKTADIARIQLQTATGYAIPIDTALSVARQIADGHASSAVTIGYPPFIGIFTAGGSQTSPQAQAQAQEQQNGFGDGFGGFGGFNGFGAPETAPACYTSNASLTVPSAV